MAKTTAVKTDDKQIKPIILKDDSNGDIFVLEFDRASVKFAEQHGFSPSDEELRMTDIEDIFFYAFRKHHPNMSKADTNKVLYDKLGGVTKEILERLAALYALPFQSLVRDEDKAKNSTMAVEM